MKTMEEAKRHPIGKIDLERIAEEYSANVDYHDSMGGYVLVSVPLYSETFRFKKGNDGLYCYDL